MPELGPHSSKWKLWTEVQELQEDNKDMHTQLSNLNAHLNMAHSHIDELNKKLYNQENKEQKKWKLNINAQCLTSDEGLRQAREIEEECKAHKHEKHEKETQHMAAEAERQHLHEQCDPNELFKGALGSKGKEDLKDIAFSLGLSLNGQKKDILEQITTYFDANPNLCQHEGYKGLFGQAKH
ncbi:hypothetical protein APHAL10511_005722 [Amanita phalloides]|nr:hypothetical protein APHAL10511_005722 [Amanita phalloides]